jgi:hypothetical protein
VSNKSVVIHANILIFSMIPGSLAGAVASIVSGVALSRIGRYKLIICMSWAIMALGYGLMTMLDNNSNKCVHTLLCLDLKTLVSFGLLVLRKNYTH